MIKRETGNKIAKVIVPAILAISMLSVPVSAAGSGVSDETVSRTRKYALEYVVVDDDAASGDAEALEAAAAPVVDSRKKDGHVSAAFRKKDGGYVLGYYKWKPYWSVCAGPTLTKSVYENVKEIAKKETNDLDLSDVTIMYMDAKGNSVCVLENGNGDYSDATEDEKKALQDMQYAGVKTKKQELAELGITSLSYDLDAEFQKASDDYSGMAYGGLTDRTWKMFHKSES